MSQRLRRTTCSVCSLLWLLALPAIAHAQTTSSGEREVSLDEILQSVRGTHPKVEASRAKVTKAEAKRQQAMGAFDLTLGGGASYTTTDAKHYGLFDITLAQPTTFWGVTFFTGYRFDLGYLPDYKDEYKQKVGKSDVYKDKYEVGAPGQVHVGLLVPLWRGGRTDKNRTKLRMTEAGITSAKADLALAQLELELKAAEAYLKWIAAGQKVVATRELLDLATKRAGQITERVKRGELAPIEELENRRAILKREGKLLEAEQSFYSAAVKLSLYLRDDNLEGQILEEDALPDDFAPYALPSREMAEAAAEAAAKRRPEWAVLQAEREQLRAEIDLAQNTAAPKIDLAGSVGNAVNEIKPEANLGVKVEMQLQRRDARGAEETARAELARIDADQRLLVDTQRAKVLAAYNELALAHRAIAVAREELDISLKGEQAERTKLELGDSTLLKVNLREQYRIEAATRLIEAERAARAALANFCTASGQDLLICMTPTGTGDTP